MLLGMPEHNSRFGQHFARKPGRKMESNAENDDLIQLVIVAFPRAQPGDRAFGKTGFLHQLFGSHPAAAHQVIHRLGEGIWKRLEYPIHVLQPFLCGKLIAVLGEGNIEDIFSAAEETERDRQEEHDENTDC